MWISLKLPQLILIQSQICDFLVYNHDPSFSNNFLTLDVSPTILVKAIKGSCYNSKPQISVA